MGTKLAATLVVFFIFLTVIWAFVGIWCISPWTLVVSLPAILLMVGMLLDILGIWRLW